ncbi:MAG: glutathione S-transferase [Hyphomicrobiaceae bacterium]|nr:glutathione S-transferase [Hyphomicrobiaceae bacterium]
MKIIETNGAPNPRRVRIFMAEKGADVVYEDIDLMVGALKTAEFSALNPFQRVPVLVLDDGTILTETVAICRYVEEIQPEPPLFGTGALERARVEMWQRRVELNFLLPVAQVFRHLHPKMAHLEVPQVPDWGEANRGRALSALTIIDDALGQSRYVAGDTFSIADITLLVAVEFMKPARITRPAELSHLARWYDEVRARPSAAA